jgi:hypothetical protein
VMLEVFSADNFRLNYFIILFDSSAYVEILPTLVTVILEMLNMISVDFYRQL